MDHDDGAIVRASVDRPELFETVFDRHHARIWTYLARLGGRACADDLAGEVFLAAFATRSRYVPERGAVPAWLYGIALNRFRTRYRSEARQARAFERAVILDLPPPSSTDAALDALADRQQLNQVIAAMSRLPAADREIVTLYAWEQLSYEAIAQVLQVEVGTVRSRLSRARRRLRELCGPTGEEGGEDHRPRVAGKELS